MAHARSTQCGGAIGTIDMEPHVVGTGHVGHGRQIVDHTEVGGSRCGHDGEQPIHVHGVESGDHVSYRITIQSTLCICGHDHDVGVHRSRGLFHRRVRATGCHHQSTSAIVATLCSFAPTMSRRDECRQVARRATADEHATRGFGEVRQVGDPSQRLILGEDRTRALQPRSRVDTSGRHHHVEDDGRLGWSARHEREKLRMVHRDTRGRQNLGVDAQRLGATDA